MHFHRSKKQTLPFASAMRTNLNFSPFVSINGRRYFCCLLPSQTHCVPVVIVVVFRIVMNSARAYFMNEAFSLFYFSTTFAGASKGTDWLLLLLRLLPNYFRRPRQDDIISFELLRIFLFLFLFRTTPECCSSNT